MCKILENIMLFVVHIDGSEANIHNPQIHDIFFNQCFKTKVEKQDTWATIAHTLLAVLPRKIK